MKKSFIVHAEVDYDDATTDPDSLCFALDKLLDTSLSTPGILDEYGKVGVGEFRCTPVIETTLFLRDGHPANDHCLPVPIMLRTQCNSEVSIATRDQAEGYDMALGEVVVEHWANQIVARIYRHDQDEPMATVRLIEDVREVQSKNKEST